MPAYLDTGQQSPIVLHRNFDKWHPTRRMYFLARKINNYSASHGKTGLLKKPSGRAMIKLFLALLEDWRDAAIERDRRRGKGRRSRPAFTRPPKKRPSRTEKQFKAAMMWWSSKYIWEKTDNGRASTETVKELVEVLVLGYRTENPEANAKN